MADIVHRVGVRGSSVEEVYAAVATIDGLAGWWTSSTSGSADLDGLIEFRFPLGGITMRVIEQVPGQRIVWQVVDGPDEWSATTVEWTFRDESGVAIVLFRHAGWKEPVEFMHHCSTKWASYLFSLKESVETGRGRPSPYDFRVADYD